MCHNHYLLDYTILRHYKLSPESPNIISMEDVNFPHHHESTNPNAITHSITHHSHMKERVMFKSKMY